MDVFGYPIENAGGGNEFETIIAKHTNTPSNPPNNKVKLYAKADNEIYKLDNMGNEVKFESSAPSGEINDGINIGTSGVNVFKTKTGLNLEFKKVNAGSDKITITDDVGNNKIDVDIDESKIDHNNLTNYDVSQHRIINDSGTSITELWSASKVDSELSGKALSSHTHEKADITDFPADTDDITEGSTNFYYTEAKVSGNTDVSANTTHRNEASLHSIINDAGTSATELWSASKISTELSGKEASGHNHTASDITDFDTEVSGNTDVSANTTHRGETTNPHAVSKTQVGLSNVVNTLHKFDGTVAPSGNDDSLAGYSVGSIWVDTDADKSYICLDATDTFAVWQEIGGGGGGGSEAVLSVPTVGDDDFSFVVRGKGNITISAKTMPSITIFETPSTVVDQRTITIPDGGEINGFTLFDEQVSGNALTRIVIDWTAVSGFNYNNTTSPYNFLLPTITFQTIQKIGSVPNFDFLNSVNPAPTAKTQFNVPSNGILNIDVQTPSGGGDIWYFITASFP